MKIKNLLFQVFFSFISTIIFAQIDTSRLLIAKYDFTLLKDTTDVNAKRFTDVMTLDIKRNEAKFYSSLRHLGLKQSNDNMQVSGNTIVVNTPPPFGDKESECVEINFEKKYYKVFDRISKIPHYYQDSLTSPAWSLLPDTILVLNEICQKATAFYRGRYIIAWFAKNIPIQQGPWLYNSLPGLILKVEDTRNQFSFVCRELIAKPQTEPVFIEYENAEKISKEIAVQRKRLYNVDPLSSIEKEWGVTMTTPGMDMNKVRKKRPYNPLDLNN
ncbi:MAG: GLPGLI family protein [Chitinophagaceae bacterium]|nr:GLPGLI family protein [Chitinophagaceae bacterium]MBK9485775.1 GLPGLI family protein [Chitinophagaceae bacterium]